MKTYKILRWLLKASALTTVMFIMQACYGTPYGFLRLDDEEQANADTLVSEDLQLVGLDNEDWQSGDDPIIP